MFRACSFNLVTMDSPSAMETDMEMQDNNSSNSRTKTKVLLCSNFHSQMHNDNRKCAIEYLILASLGLCKSLNAVYSDIVVCENRYFRVHQTTHIKGQPQ